MNEAPKPITVYLVDDQAMIRAAFRSLLAESGEFEVLGDSADARKAVDQIERLKPDAAVLDVSMPGLSGIDAIALIRKVHPRIKIVMLTHHEGETFVEQAIKAGAEGYLSKDSDPSELMLALRAVTRGDPYISPKVARGLISRARGGETVPQQSSRVEQMTSREREVFQLLAIGKSNKEVAYALGISLGTVKKHRENLQRKLDCHSAAELARLAIREGLLES
jgi:DNA-binding NarL/FixJ family response regulator